MARIVSYRVPDRLATGRWRFSIGLLRWRTIQDQAPRPRHGNSRHDPHQRLRRRDLQGPQRAARRAGSQRHPPHRVPLDPRHQRARPRRRAARGVPRAAPRPGVRPQRDRLAGRQDQDRRARTTSTSSGSGARWTWPTSTRPRGSGSSATTCPPATTRPSIATETIRPDDRPGPTRRRAGRVAPAREREGDLRRHRRAGARHPRDGRICPACRTPSTRPTTSRSASRSTRPGRLLRPRVTHFHVKDYDSRTHKNVPAGQGDGQIPRLIADAVAHGYDGFCVLEPHLVIAELSLRLHRPRTLRRRRPRPQGHPRRAQDRLRLKACPVGRLPRDPGGFLKNG